MKRHLTGFRHISGLFTGRPGRSAAQRSDAGIALTQWSKKLVFRPAGATHCSDKREIWHGDSSLTRAKFHVYPAEMWESSPQNCQNLEFCAQIWPQGRLVCTIFTQFSAFVRGYR